MKKYHLYNNITGWCVFAIALATYLLTIEPTASLWDCGEFITSAHKLEVGHPPGAPLFMLMGRLFSLFASNDKVALMINAFSALCSAFTILFLFWSITHLARKLVDKTVETFTTSEYVSVLGSGVIGALAFTFSDSFWFSAVEGEVYAASSVFTALSFWAVLKWEEEADQTFANRWLVLLAYITGLSIGVHLLNLLVVPTMIFIYYFRKNAVSTTLGIVKCGLFSLVLLAFLVWGIIPWVPLVGSWFELLFVNDWSLPVNSGLLVYVSLLAVGLIFAVYWTKKNQHPIANTIALSFAMCILGYGSYAMIVIRSVANPPMEQNAPDNIFSLMSYLNRDQYGSRPLLTGAYFNYADSKTTTSFSYGLFGDKYIKENWSQDEEYEYKVFFPRMFSRQAQHVSVYNSYIKRGKSVRKLNGETVRIPLFTENLTYLWDYQLNYMYWRYFMWNFAGRQNDIQSSKTSSNPADPTKGNWISGITWLDEARLGSENLQPSSLAQNKGTNKYYCLPLILGLIGLAYQALRDKRNFSVVMMLFFLTGIAIVIYLNQSPNEVRERDYAYAGSFYAFAIWIGLGVMAIYKTISQWKPDVTKQAAYLAVIISLPVPLLMAQQNWDDHNRSGSYIATDFGYNYLNSCDKNAIIYTYGDNDTFPLWYNQEVEEVRTDVRVANTSYLSADWYYRQMLRRTYDSDPIKSSATPAKISGMRRNIVLLQELTKDPLPLKTALDFVMSDDPDKMVTTRMAGNIKMNVMPAKKLFLPIDKAAVLASGLVAASDSAAIVSQINITVPDMIYKNMLGVLDFMANNFPERPIYYNNDRSLTMGVDNNLKLEGLVYRLVPENVQISGKVNIDKTFDLLVNKFRYRGANDPNVYFDETARRMLSYYRTSFFTLADALAAKGDKARLATLMDKYHEAIPLITPQMWYYSVPAVKHYFNAGQSDRALAAAKELIEEYRMMSKYYTGKGMAYRMYFLSEFQDLYQGLDTLNKLLADKSPELSAEVGALMQSPELKFGIDALIMSQQQGE